MGAARYGGQGCGLCGPARHLPGHDRNAESIREFQPHLEVPRPGIAARRALPQCHGVYASRVDAWFITGASRTVPTPILPAGGTEIHVVCPLDRDAIPAGSARALQPARREQVLWRLAAAAGGPLGRGDGLSG